MLVKFAAYLQRKRSNGLSAPPPVNTDNDFQSAGRDGVPQFQALMLPLLKVMGGGHEMTTTQMRDAVAVDIGMSTTPLIQPLPDGTQNTFNNRLGWAISFLFTAGLLERPGRATYVISETGKQLLLRPPVEIDAEFLRSYEEFNRSYDSPRGTHGELPPDKDIDSKSITEEQIEIDFSQIQRQLSDEVTGKIKQLRPEDFKKLITYLLETITSSRQKT
jgi:restriction system protein